MKSFPLITLLFIITSFSLNSCRKGCTNPYAENYDAKAKKEDGSCILPETDIEVPDTYTFVDENGNSTVSFSGQQSRLDMLSEMVTYMKTGNVIGTTVNSDSLKSMYANNGYIWQDVNGLGLTGSTKQLKNKTAFYTADGSPDANVQLLFENMMDSLAYISSLSQTGSLGTSGVWSNDGVSGPYLMNAQGFEYTQLIEKGLMSSVFSSQLTVNYLGTITDDDNITLEDGKYYTEMQHHWDEAYGYFTSSTNFPTSGTDRFWGKYASGRESVLGSASKISEAFRTGRAAIDAQEYEIRDEQVTIIRDEMERLQAACAIHYLNEAKNNMTNNTTRNHQLSEAYAFLHGMKYGYNCLYGSGMSLTDIDQGLLYLTDDFNTVNTSNINLCIDLIASKTGLTTIKGDL